jgi:two-component system NtrC family response regulator
MNSGRVLLIDDEESIRKVLGFILEEAGYEVLTADSGRGGIEAAKKARPDLVLTDIKMPDGDGITVLREIKALDPGIPVIILTAFGSIETAVEAMKLGASDYITKPISRDELKITVDKALKLNRLEKENEDLKRSIKEKYSFENIIGLSPAMAKVFEVISKIAATDASVLITGESGTGKELVAKAIHFNSPRRSARLVTVNCAAIPSELLESELFGHVRGAFTGAIRNKEGKFQSAHRGTLFLDEIGSLPLTLQAKLLRALQEREIERVGDEQPIAVDVRIIAATNRSLPELIREGKFREDLFYRLNVVPIELPPLRQRMSDIPLLAGHFAAKYAAGANVSFSDGALRALQEYNWPGNVRELENFCERLVLMRTRDSITESDVKTHMETLAKEQAALSSPTALSLPELERRAIIDALNGANWNQSQAARVLGIPRHVLIYRMKKFGIVPPSRDKAQE